jgi:hypothetical protein
MNADTMDDLNRLDVCFLFMDAAYLFRDEQVTDHCKRTILRFLFIQIDNILKLAGRTKNKLRKEHLIAKGEEEQIKQLIGGLANSYDHAYDTIRDKIAAHSQPLDLVSLLNWWNDIDQTTIAVLYEDAKKIQTALASVKGLHFQGIADYAKLAIPSTNPISLALNSQVPSFSSDRLGLSRPNVVSMIACHPSQEKAQTILSIIDFLGIDFALTSATGAPTTNYQNLLFDIGWLLAMVDICALIDNLFHDKQYDQSLLSHWKSDMAGYEILSRLDKSRDVVIEKQIRDIRNTLGAHLDSTNKVSDVLSQFKSIDLASAHGYACHLVNSFFDACRQDMRTRIFCIQNAPINGVISVQSNGYKPFQA